MVKNIAFALELIGDRRKINVRDKIGRKDME